LEDTKSSLLLRCHSVVTSLNRHDNEASSITTTSEAADWLKMRCRWPLTGIVYG